MAKKRLNKWEKEVLALKRLKEHDLELELFNQYKTLKEELEQYVADNLPLIDEMKPYQVANLNRRIANLNEIDELLDEAHEIVSEKLKDYTDDSYVNGHNHTKYLVEQKINQPTDIGFVDRQSIRQLLTSPIDDQILSANLYRNREKLARDVQSTLMSHYANPKSYAQIANELASKTEADFNRSMRIARTEGNRRYSQGQLHSQQEAQELGIEIKKMWSATADGRTRGTHRALDGQIRDIGEDFLSNSGASGQAPGMMGSAAEDINCRCSSVSIVEGIMPTHRRYYENGDSYVGEYKNYSEWEQSYAGRDTERVTEN